MKNSTSVTLVDVHEPTVNLSCDGAGDSGQTNTTGPPLDPLITLRVPAIMFASGVFGNLLAIIFLIRSSREHKQTVFYRLVGALACTDLFGTCTTSPVTLAVYANKMKWVGGEGLCNYESFMLIFASYSTIFIIGIMAIDRFISMSKPYFYEQYITTREAHVAIVSLWTFAAIMGCLPIIGLGENIIQFPGTWCFFTFTSSKLRNKIFTYSYASIALLVVGLTAVSNVYVTLILLKMRRKATRSMNLCSTRRNDSELQMMTLLLGIIVVFSACWCPFMIRLLVNQTNEKQLDVKADLGALRLASLNQILDPWIYILFRRELFVRTARCLTRLGIALRTRIRTCLCRSKPPDRTCDVTGSIMDMKQMEKLQPSSSDGGPYIETGNEYETANGGPVEHSVTFCGVSNNAHAQNVNNVTDATFPLVDFKQKDLNAKKIRTNRRSDRSSTYDSDSQRTSGNSLILKHDFCLFCLSNHQKRVVQLSKLYTPYSEDENTTGDDTKEGCNYVNDSAKKEQLYGEIKMHPCCTCNERRSSVGNET